MNTAHDLGILQPARISERVVVLCAPGLSTRAVWPAGGFGSLVFLWSLAVTLEWTHILTGRVTFVRWPALGEAFFWRRALRERFGVRG